ncbi:phage protein Gp27 family protein [Zavarzinia aquatilis]|uniref:DUF3486 domain-containing protein n=1 Tax=Zavarzinia aquatilis TaxID=2211142 RepID=A0A317DUZ8_9PROT|nr:phage protein Gp27 family protein [Zavarzinia aquatilis]PWR17686.1 hypothetical protein DKG74_20575 [Zavarzinia aquatilis]
MPRRSSIDRLPPEILEAAERMWASHQFTLAEMVERINALSPPDPVSRSALHRKTQEWDEELKEIRQARDLSRAWKQSVAEDPDGDIGSIVGEQLNVLAFRVVKTMRSKDEVPLDELAKAAKLGRDLATSDKLRADREQLVRAVTAPIDVIQIVLKRLADKVNETGRPELAEALLEVLEPVGLELAREFG